MISPVLHFPQDIHMNTTTVSLCAIICITILVVIHLLHHHNGPLFATALATIAGLAGYTTKTTNSTKS